MMMDLSSPLSPEEDRLLHRNQSLSSPTPAPSASHFLPSSSSSSSIAASSHLHASNLARKIMVATGFGTSTRATGNRGGSNRASPPPSISTTARYSPTKRSPRSVRAPEAAPFVGTCSKVYSTPSSMLPSPLATPRSIQHFSFPPLPSHSHSADPSSMTDVEMKIDSRSTPQLSRISPNANFNDYPATPDSHSQSQSQSQTGHHFISSKQILAQQPGLRDITSGKTSHIPALPITPPLTPESGFSTVCLPSIQLVQSPPLQPAFPTLSARLLSNHTLHPLFSQQYTILEELGSGGFGFVVSASRLCDGATVAVKFLYRTKVPTHGWVNSRHWGDTSGLMSRDDGKTIVPMEAYILRNVRHSGVVAYLDLFEDESYFYLIMEHHGTPWKTSQQALVGSNYTSPSDLPALAASVSSSSHTTPELLSSSASSCSSSSESGLVLTPLSSPDLLSTTFGNPTRPVPMSRKLSCDLFECIEQYSRFSETTARYVFAQIVEVVWALGQMGICHRDIKDENIVIDSSFKVKLIDFGAAVIFDPQQPAPFYNRFHGTTSFASAEILRGEPYQAPTSEIWSLGVLLSILITGECPFVDAAAAAIGKFSRPKVRLGRAVQDLLIRSLDLNIARRITIDEMRRHPWLAGALQEGAKESNMLL